MRGTLTFNVLIESLSSGQLLIKGFLLLARGSSKSTLVDQNLLFFILYNGESVVLNHDKLNLLQINFIRRLTEQFKLVV